jgi:hypothetical protein
MKVLQLSLADLIKKSAKSICYMRKPEKDFTQQKANSKLPEIEEQKIYYNMRGTYIANAIIRLNGNVEEIQLNINYTFDSIEINELAAVFVEKKNINNTIELWYKNICLMQTAAYQAFAKSNINKQLQTASFAIANGATPLKMDLKNKFLRSELKMGEQEIYSIYVPEPKEIVNYFIEKAIHSLNYESAILWDAKHKYKDFDFLHTNINYRNINDGQPA